MGYAEMLHEEMKDRDLTEHTEQLLQAACKGKQIAETIMLVGSRSTGKKKAVAWPSLINETLLSLGPYSQTAAVHIRQEFTLKDPVIMADPDELKQLLTQLLKNAYHAMENNGGMLTLKLDSVLLEPHCKQWYPLLKPGSYCHLIISDTGHGFKPEVLERAFDPYFTTKPFGTGKGLGLAIAHGIVSKYNGAIHISSKPGSGTSVEVLLPSA